MRNVVPLVMLIGFTFAGAAGAAGAAAPFDVRDAHAFDAMVVSLDRAGFRYVMTDPQSNKPVWQRRWMGRARFTATTVFDFLTTSRSWARGRARSIAVGDIVKIYGIERGRSTDIAVYRLEDRGRP